MGYAKNLLTILKPGTQYYRVLEYLVNNGSITIQDMTNKMYINSPRDVICYLRKKDVNIKSIQRRSKNGTVYIEYRLEDTDD